MTMKHIFLNGASYQTTAQTMADLVVEQALENKRFAIEADNALIPKSQLADTAIQDAMKIEIVVAVGGG